MKATERQKAYFREYFQKNKGAIAERKRRHYQEHENDRIASQEYYQNHKEQVWSRRPENAERIRQYQLATKEKRKATAREWHRRLKQDVIFFYSKGKGSCNKCGFNDIKALTIDHINGGGNKHKKQEGITNFYSWLRNNNYPPGYQTLCMNCQFIKKIEENENQWRRIKTNAENKNSRH